MKKIIVSSLIVFIGSISFADQCAFISKTQAEKAVKALLDTQSVQSLCEPCGETSAKIISVNSLGLRKANFKNFSEVVINEKGIDLAYTYVNGLNLAKLVGCTAHDVSSSLK